MGGITFTSGISKAINGNSITFMRSIKLATQKGSIRCNSGGPYR